MLAALATTCSSSAGFCRVGMIGWIIVHQCTDKAWMTAPYGINKKVPLNEASKPREIPTKGPVQVWWFSYCTTGGMCETTTSLPCGKQRRHVVSSSTHAVKQINLPVTLLARSELHQVIQQHPSSIAILATMVRSWIARGLPFFLTLACPLVATSDKWMDILHGIKRSKKPGNWRMCFQFGRVVNHVFLIFRARTRVGHIHYTCCLVGTSKHPMSNISRNQQAPKRQTIKV